MKQNAQPAENAAFKYLCLVKRSSSTIEAITFANKSNKQTCAPMQRSTPGLIKVFFLFSLIHSGTIAHAQNLSQDEIIASYLYNFVKHITWPASNTSPIVNIGIYKPVDIPFSEQLSGHFENARYNGKPILVTPFTELSQIRAYHIVFLEQENSKAIHALHAAIDTHPVLLVTTNFSEKQLVMINLYTTEDNRFRFEVNKANLLLHSLEAKPELILNGGSEIDVARLFQQGQASLIKMQENFRAKENELKKLNEENTQLNTHLAMLQSSIQHSLKQVQRQEALIAQQRAELQQTEQDKKNLQEDIRLKTQELVNRQSLLSKIGSDIIDKERQLASLNDTIITQKSRIIELDQRISTQGIVLNNLLFVFAIVLILIAVIAWAYVNKRRDAIRLENRGRELNIAKDKLAIAKVKAEEANQAKSEFLSLMSHELRTPLQAIIGYTDVVIEELRLDGMDQLTGDLDRVVNNSERLLRLINGVLDLAKVESGNMDLHLGPVDLRSIVNDAVANVRPQYDEKALPLHIQVENGPRLAVADQEKLLHIILNLLSNACKFTDSGLVKVIAEHRENHIYISVQDTGAGISPDRLPYVFERFRQADSSTTRRYSGSGLGLAITKQFCELMGGSVNVHSELNMGTTFIINIPLPIQQKSYQLNSLPDTPAAHTDTSVARESLPANYKASIVMIDDDAEFLGIMSRTLQKSGYRVHTATTAAQGLELANEVVPDVITLDLLLPDRHGWDLLQKIKQIPQLAEIPVIVASVLIDRKKGKELGAAACLSKPIARTALKLAVEKYASGVAVD